MFFLPRSFGIYTTNLHYWCRNQVDLEQTTWNAQDWRGCVCCICRRLLCSVFEANESRCWLRRGRRGYYINAVYHWYVSCSLPTVESPWLVLGSVLVAARYQWEGRVSNSGLCFMKVTEAGNIYMRITLTCPVGFWQDCVHFYSHRCNFQFIVNFSQRNL